MSGLPRVPSSVKPRDVFSIMVLDPIERATHWLMSGAEVSDADLRQLRAIRQRLGALDSALAARERAAGEVMEDEE